MKTGSRRPWGRLFYFLAAFVLFACTLALQAAGPNTTTISDVVYRADGNPASGTLLISWPAFTTGGGKAVAAGNMSLAIGPAGVVTVLLIPNQGATPAGTYYRVVFKLNDGSSNVENWVVPATGPTTIAAIRATIVSPTQAVVMGNATRIQSVAVEAATPQHGEGLFYNAATAQYEPAAPGAAAIPDADAATKGKLQLAGDLGGTAAAPTVPGLANKVGKTGDETIAGKKLFTDPTSWTIAHTVQPTDQHPEWGGWFDDIPQRFDIHYTLNGAAPGAVENGQVQTGFMGTFIPAGGWPDGFDLTHLGGFWSEVWIANDDASGGPSFNITRAAALEGNVWLGGGMTANHASGVLGQVATANSAHATRISAFNAHQWDAYDTSIVDHAAGLWIEANSKDPGATLTDSDGIYIDPLAAGVHNKAIHIADQGAGANNYAIYVEGGKSHFGGPVDGITAAMVGLGNVDNTSDAAKPISTATQAALDLKLNTAALTSTLIVSKFNTGICSGYLKSDGTCDTPGGAGTVTHTSGALTAGKLAIGNGTADVKVDTGCSTDGAGALTCGSFTTSGAAADNWTAMADGSPANGDDWYSSTTVYRRKFQANTTTQTYAWMSDLPADTPVVAQHWLTSYDATAHTFGQVQPACGDLSDSGALCQASSVTLAQVPAALLVRTCEYTITGSGAAGVLQDTDDELGKCLNKFGTTWKVSYIGACRDGLGGSNPTIMVSKGNAGADLLTGNITVAGTCSSGTYTAGTLVADSGANRQIADGGATDIKLVAAGGTAVEVTVVVTGSLQ